MKAIHRKRLLNVARALRESPAPDKFDMVTFGYPCGTPACAFGHYAARGDLQDDFILRLLPGIDRSFASIMHKSSGAAIYWDEPEVLEHFGISDPESDELFSCEGCGRAKTAIEAAEFIERWVAEREGDHA